MELRGTPLLNEHTSLGARMAPFGGWNMPIQYAGIIAEHLWTRRNASLFDICHMGEFLIRGEAEKSGLEGIVTFRLSSMFVGSCRYGFILNESGGILDDLVIYRINNEEWMAVVNAATTEGDAAHFRTNLSGGVVFNDLSGKLGKLDLQGPLSGAVMKDIAGPKIEGLRYYNFGKFNVLGEDVIISRTGYTGELGYEIYISNEKVRKLWGLILRDNRVKPAGLGARDTLRLEMGYPLYGQDIDSNTTPFEAGLGKFAELTKEFIGRDALVKADKEGRARRFVCFKADSRRSPRHGHKIFVDGKESGLVTSGSYAPSLECGIGMGYVGENLKPGVDIIVGDGSVGIKVEVTNKPFYKNGTVKK